MIITRLQNKLLTHPRFGKFMPWFICAIAALFYSYEYLLRISPSVMTAELMAYYQINASTFGVITAMYYYAYTPLQLVVGLLMDWFGPRKLLTLACFMCVVGAYWFGGTTSILLASFGRFMVGFGSAFAFVGILKLATVWLPPDRLALVTGLSAALGTFGAMAGNLVMTKMVIDLGWQKTVFLSSYLGLLIVVLLWVFIKDNQESRISLKVKDLAIKPDFVQGLRDFATIISNRQIWINGAISCLLYLPTTVFAEMWGKTYLEQVYGISSEQSAFAIAILFLGFAVGAPLSGFISDTIKLRKLPIIVGNVFSLLLFMCLIIPASLSAMTIYIILFLLGIMYSTHVINFAIGREISPKNAAGSALAVTNMLVMLGGLLFQPLSSYLLDLSANMQQLDATYNYSSKDFKFAISIIPLGLFCSLILSFLLQETRCQISED